MKNGHTIGLCVRPMVLTAVILLTLVLAAACQRKGGEAVRSMYYWQTTFRIDSTEREFLSRHRVKRLYVRYFDVVVDRRGEVMPNATIAFDDTVPEGLEVVPTVFVMNDCIGIAPDDLAQKIVGRILQMNETHGIGRVSEVQIDCDWTRTTQAAYFGLLRSMRKLLAGHGIRLSATIRLHQLSMEVPPVDRGTLMMYNTGDVANPKERNPILDVDRVKAYMPRVARYRLPLSVAYPIFGWEVVFRRGHFAGIIHYEGEIPLLPTDDVRRYRADMQEIKKAKSWCRDAEDEIILFDLSTQNITNLKAEDYETIYSR